ncbi:MAG TPA: hypothetical protein VMT73_14130 [Anaerolineales bacterium]|nr:hypothetical protein [Anaerolineales bacterium]
MPLSQVLEVAIGLIVVYYLLGSVVSMITKGITDSLETRGVALEEYLKKLVGERSVDLTNLPQIKALQPIRYKSVLSVFQTETKKVEKIPVSTLVDAFFDMTGLTGQNNLSGEQLIHLLNQLPASEGQQAVLQWVQQGVTDVKEIRGRATDYIGGILDQAAATFKANARAIVILLSIVVTFAFGVDSIQFAKDLWNNADLRAAAQAKADAIVQQQGAGADIGTIVNQLNEFSLRLGWWEVQQVPAFTDIPGWAEFISLKLAGLVLTAIAVSQGSSFWYDLLKKVTGNGGGGVSSDGGDGGDAVG